VKCPLDIFTVEPCFDRGCCSNDEIQDIAILELCINDTEDDETQAVTQYELNGKVVCRISYFTEGSHM
jgi:hypothetical protein